MGRNFRIDFCVFSIRGWYLRKSGCLGRKVISEKSVLRRKELRIGLNVEKLN